MKKVHFLCGILVSMLLLTLHASAAELKFKPDGGGYFIYCNNNEYIRRSDLSDSSNPAPSYIMNNQNMTNGKYTLYFSHINHTEETKTPKPDDSADRDRLGLSDEEIRGLSEVTDCGFDIEADVCFIAKTDTKLRFTAIGFEVQQPLDYYYTNRHIRYEDSWGCIGAVADYMGRPIFGLNSVEKYRPAKFTPFDVEISAGEVVWLSRYIKNYSAVPWLKPVHMLADFEILYGCADINIAALKAGDKLGDRSRHCLDAAHGRYYRDKQYKGVASSLPSVTAELEYTVDDSLPNGSRLPVTVFNQYVPDGNEVDEWITHINPQNDKNIRRSAAESDILPIEYFDPSKKLLYGTSVPDNARSSIWIFDTRHSDTKTFDPSLGVADRDSFVPNYEIGIYKDNVRSSGNLANYCVKTNYRLKINNAGSKTRYFNYNAKTTASIVVSVKDKNGAYTDSHANVKVSDNTAKEETLAFAELPPNTSTEFTVEVFLPINYVGGIKNNFTVTDTKPEMQFPEDMKQRCTVDPHFTGNNFVKWTDGRLNVSEDGKTWSAVETDENVREIFRGNTDNYKIAYVNGCYAVWWYAFVPTPAYYSPYLKYKSDVFFLDSGFHLIKKVSFDSYPEEVAFAGGKFLVKADKIYCSADLDEWTEYKHTELNLPADNGSGIILAAKTCGETYFSPDNGENFYKISYRADVKPPRYIDVLGDVYFYAEGSSIYTSYDGVEWTQTAASQPIKTLARVGNSFLVNGTEKLDIPERTEYINVVLNGEVMQYDRQVKHYDNGTLIPLEATAEKIGAEYTFSERDGSAVLKYGKKTLRLRAGSNLLTDGKEKTYMRCSTQYMYERVFIPAEEVLGKLGFDAEYITSAKTLVISSDTAKETNNAKTADNSETTVTAAEK